MALNGLRMMPLFPSPPLKNCTAGLPQYVFKADISDVAFLFVQLLKPAPGIHSFTFSFLPPSVSVQTDTLNPVQSRAGFLSWYRHSSLTALPQGPHSGPGFSVPVRQHLIDPVRATGKYVLISRLCGYKERLGCVGAPRPTLPAGHVLRDRARGIPAG